MTIDLQSSFRLLNDFIIEHARKNDESALIKELKELFAERIESNRLLEKVNSVEQFLHLLKRRGLYGPEEFYAFRVIKKIISNSEFDNLVEQHKRLLNGHVPSKLENQYAQRRRQQPFNPNAPTIPGDDSMTHERKVRIFRVLADGLPSRHIEGLSSANFSSLARHLKFKANEIREIEINQSISSRTVILLEEHSHRENWWPTLLSKLEVIKRCDLKAVVEKL